MTTCNNIILSQPAAGQTLNHDIPDDVSARLNFGPEEISGLRMGGDGQLIIDFADGGQINISNFTEVVDNGNLIYLNDGTLVDPSILTSSLQSPQEFNAIEAASGSEAIRINQPEANTTQEISLEQGMEYVCNFDPANAATVETIDGKMVLTFADGSQIVINNYQTAMMGELPAVLTVEDGNVIEGEEILTQLVEVQEFSEVEVEPVEEILELSDAEPAIAETIANIEPAAGEDVVQTLAQIEPASGEASAGNTGYGFNSSPSSAPLNSPFAIGPLGATQLAYSAPQFSQQNFVPFDPTPIVSDERVDLDETNLSGSDLVAEGKIDVDFGGDAVGSFRPTGGFTATCEVAGDVLQSGGVPVDVSQTPNGYVGVANGVTIFTFVLDTATGEYVYTQLGPFDHADTSDANEPICLDFGVIVTDGDGDSATTNVRVNVLDDAPIVSAQPLVKIDETDAVNGVLTASGQINADMGQDVGGKYTGNGEFSYEGSVDNGVLTSNGNTVSVTYDAATGTYTGVAGGETIFTVAINPHTGAYTYSQFGPLDHADANYANDHMILNFGFNVTDFDGDAASGQIQIEVCDDGPTIHDASGTVDETNLANPLVATGTVSVDFGFDGKGSIGPNGHFTSGGSQTDGTLTHNGVAVVVTQTANGYVGVANGVTVFTMEIDAMTGEYTYTQVENFDHADVNDPNDVITLNFGIDVTDFDGDSASATITINVVDDAPIANDDKANVEEGDSATGNVLHNDLASCDEDTTVTSVTFEGQNYEVPAGGFVTVEGNNGTLTMNSDGSYTYEANDAAGETIRTFEVVDPMGGDKAGDIKSVSGSLNETTNEFTFTTVINGDANGFTLVLNDGPNPKGAAGQLPQFYFDASGTTPVVMAYGYNGLGGVPGTTDSAFDGSQAAGVQAPDQMFSSLNANSPFSNIAVTTDADGNQVLSFTVDTDAINSHTPLYNDAGGWEGLNFDDLVGAWFHPVSGVESAYGTDGFLTQFDFDQRSGWDSNFTPTNTITTGGAEDSFTYTITDADGDASTANLDVCIADDGNPTGIYGENITDDTNLNDDGMDMVTGDIHVDYHGDGPGTTTGNGSFNASSHNLPNGVLSHAGTQIEVTFDATTNTYTGVAGNATVFTMVINANGTYKFTQFESVDHGNTAARNEQIFLQFGVTATDSDGDTGEGVVQIRVRDDAPVAADDTATIGDNTTVSGNVLTNDDFGADDTKIEVYNPGTFEGQYGTLVLNLDGTFTYTRNGREGGVDTFEYQICDGDHDVDTATLTITLGKMNDQPTIETSVKGVNEIELCDGPLVVNKTLVHDFGDDGAGAITVNGQSAVKFKVGGQDQTLTVDGEPVSIVTTGNNGYVGTANGQTIFTLTVNPQTGEYTYTQYAGVDHPGVGLAGTNDVIWLKLGVTITDADGDSANAYVNIDIRDTAPVAANDTDSVSEGTATTGNILTNDVNCEDGSSVCAVVFGNHTVEVPATGTVSVTGQYGVLTISADGSYSYQANNNNPDGIDVFTYTMKDQDGDTSSANLAITVTSVDGVPTIEQFNNPYSECGVVDGPIVIQETLTHDFGVDGAGAITPTGDVNVKFKLGGPTETLTSDGTPVVFTQTANGYVGKAGGETVISLVIDPATGEYTYKQFSAVDHQAPGTDGDDVIWIVFGVQITDADGDSASTYIVIDVSDAEPVAHDDVNAAGEGEVVDGNVLNNDENCADEGSAVCEVVFGNQTIAVPAAGSVSVTGQYGVLTISADGTYTYQANNNNPEGVDVFTYTMKDGDGDTSTANLSITVSADDQTPINVSGVGATDDTNLANGNDVETGVINVDYQGDGPGETCGNGDFASAGQRLGGALSSGGVPVNVTFNAGSNTYTGTAGGQVVFTMVINADATYKFTQFEELDHSNTNSNNEALFLDFGVTAKDSDGDEGTGTVRITVRDDAPEANDDVASLGENGQTATGNVLTNDNFGSDDTKIEVYTPGTFQGQYGTLVLNLDGSYTYTRNGQDGGTDVFEYQICDGDHDIDTATLTITVAEIDQTPINVGGTGQTDDTNLLDDGKDVETGVINVDYQGDGPGETCGNGDFASAGQRLGGALSSGGVPVNVTFNAGSNTYTGTAGGQVVFTMVINADATYKFTQFEELDHSNTNSNNEALFLDFGVTAKDSDGDEGTGTVRITVRDDAPEAADDTAAIGPNGVRATGNVLTNDDKGADNGANVMVTTAGTFEGQYGTLVLNMDGSYTYTRNGREGGTDVFNYTMKDHDGDTSSAQLTVSVGRENDVPTITTSVTGVNEVDFCDHETLVVNKTLVHDFGADGAGAITVNGTTAVKFKVGGQDQTLTVDGVPVVITQSGNGYVGKAGNLTVFTMSVDSQTGEYTYQQFSGVDHPGVGLAGTNDVIWLKLGVTITDADGDSADAYVNIDIRDTAPVAVDDKAVTVGDITVDTLSLNLTSADVAGTQSSFTRDGISISSNTGGDLVWVNHRNGPGAGIAGNGTDKVYGSREELRIDFATTVTSAVITLGDMGSNNVGDHFTYEVHLADGTSVTETISIQGNGLVGETFTFDVSGYSSEIVGVDLVGGPSFLLNDVQATNVVSTGGDAIGNVLTNDEVCEDHDVSVTSIQFGNQSYNIAEGGQRVIQGDNGTLTIKSDGTYSYQANAAPSQTVYSFNQNHPGGRDAAGDILNTAGSFNATTNEFNFSFVIEGHDANGFTLVMNDGPNPKDHPGEMAIFYFDASQGGEPVVSVYGYNGANSFNSYRDGSSANGVQAPDRILGSNDANNPFTNIRVTTDAHGNQVFSFSMDATDVVNHSPAYTEAGTDWTGVSFDELMGIWFHPVSGLETSYDANGNLTSWNIEDQSWWDAGNQNTQTTIIPGSAGGEDTFTYTITDADGDTSTATLTICPEDGGATHTVVYNPVTNPQAYDNVEEVSGNGSYYGTNGESDLFILDAINNGAPILRNFDLGEDSVDISGLLEGYDPVTDAINDFVHVTNSGAGDDTWVYVDSDGKGGQGSQIAVRLDNTNNNTLEDLLENGNLIV